MNTVITSCIIVFYLNTIVSPNTFYISIKYEITYVDFLQGSLENDINQDFQDAIDVIQHHSLHYDTGIWYLFYH